MIEDFHLSRAFRQMLLLVFTGLQLLPQLQAQSSDWQAPAWADTLVNTHSRAADIAEGKALFNAICFVCHGKSGLGDGINAASLARKPANLTSEAVQQQSDGALFWKITEGNPPMLSFKNTLSEAQRWKVISYVRTLRAETSETAEIPASTTAQEPAGEKKAPLAANDEPEPVEGGNKTEEIPAKPFNPYAAVKSGKALFNGICAACHTIGKGMRVGPDLQGVNAKHSEAWLLKWISCSQCLVEAGDETAVALFEKYKRSVMPNHDYLADDQLQSLLSYIEEATATLAKAPPEPAVATTYAAQSGPATAAPVMVTATAPSRGSLRTVHWVLIGFAIMMLLLLYVLVEVIVTLAEATKKQTQNAENDSSPSA